MRNALRAVLAVAVVLALEAPAGAQDLSAQAEQLAAEAPLEAPAAAPRERSIAWMYAYTAGGHLADYVSSLHFSMNGSACLEANPLARHPDGTFDARKGAIGVALSVSAEWLALRASKRTTNRFARGLLRGVALTSGSIGWGSAFYNTVPTHPCDRYRRLADGTVRLR